MKSVRVGHLDYAILPLEESEISDNWGMFDGRKQQIRLAVNFPSRQKWAETLIHEIKHAIRCIQGISVKDGEERCVRQEAIAWASVIRDNPELFDEIQDALK